MKGHKTFSNYLLFYLFDAVIVYAYNLKVLSIFIQMTKYSPPVVLKWIPKLSLLNQTGIRFSISAFASLQS